MGGGESFRWVLIVWLFLVARRGGARGEIEKKWFFFGPLYNGWSCRKR
jgi:hypothetical protein